MKQSSGFKQIGLELLAIGLITLLFRSHFPRWADGTTLPWLMLLPLLLIVLVSRFWPVITGLCRSVLIVENLIIMSTIVLLIGLTRWYVLVYHQAFPSSDNEITVLMVKHVLEGLTRPVFYYGQPYQGTLHVYLYALASLYVSPIKQAMYLVNLGLFALAVLVYYRLLSTFFQVDRWFYLLMSTACLSGLIYLSIDPLRGFPLCVVLMGSVLLLVYRALFEDRPEYVSLGGLLAGLLFWLYQPSLALTGLVVILLLIRLKPRHTTLFFCSSFLVGAWPLILSEIYTRGLTIKALLVTSGPGALPDLKHFISIFFSPVLHLDDDPAFRGVMIIFTLFFLTGFGLFVHKAWSKRNRSALYLPALYAVLMIMLSFSGIGPDQVRYRVHYQLYSLWSLLFICAIFQIKPSRIRMLLRLTALALWIGSTLLFWQQDVPLWQKSHFEHIRSRDMLLELSGSTKTIVGDYWYTMKYYADLEPDQFVVPAADVFERENPFHPLIIRFLPNQLTLARHLEKEPFALITTQQFCHRIENTLAQLKIMFLKQKLLNDEIVYYAFNHVIRPEILSYLYYPFEYSSEIDALFQSIRTPYVNNSCRIRQITTRGPRLEIQLSVPREGLWSLPHYRVQLQDSDRTFLIDAPFHFRDGSMTMVLPEGMVLPPGEYTCTLTFLNQPIYTQSGIEYNPDLIDRPRPILTFDRLTDLPELVVYHCEDQSLEKPHFLKGFPLEEELSMIVHDPTIRTIVLELFCPLDFSSPLWEQCFKQQLLIEHDGQTTSFELDDGYNTISFSCEPDLPITLRQRHRTLVRVRTNSLAQNQFRLVNTGLILTGLELLDQTGRRKHSCLPVLSIEK
ncbi:hypothetical protein JXQ70_18840 [bacterium]|nr:hypothetical protein [bacterium]